MRMPGKLFVLGLTGPTGAGKSVLARALEAEGFAVIDADRLARQVTEPGSPTLRELAAAFSPAVLRADGTRDRALLARLAFASPESTRRLNAVTHPAILALTRQRMQELEAAGCPGAVLDAPLLYESGADALCDRVAVALAPKEERIRRIRERDGLTEEEAVRRVAAQNDDSYYEGRGAILLINGGTLAGWEQQAGELARRMKRWCAAD